jgi:hypothetical protein
MSDVFRFHQSRSPLKAPVRQVVSLNISTHASQGGVTGPTRAVDNLPWLSTVMSAAALKLLTPKPPSGAGKGGGSLHDALRAAHDAGDLDRFIAAASDFHRTQSVLTLSGLHPISQAAYALFDGMGASIERPRVNDLFARLEAEDTAFSAYLRNGLAADLARLNDTMLALEALRLHGGQQALSHTLALKSLYSLAIAHDLRARDREGWSVEPLKRVFDMRVHLPEWVWELDPCRSGDPIRDAAAPGAGPGKELAVSPLVRKVQAVKAFAAAAGAPSEDHACECECDDSCVPQDPCCVHARSFMTDLLVVREKLQCYLPADISDIVNVLAGESFSRKHSALLQIEQTQETETTVNGSEERDNQKSERFELSNEAQKTIESSAQFDAGVTANQSWGSGSATFTSNLSLNNSTTATDKTARNFARDIVDRSVVKIERNVRQLASRKLLSKTREVNRHAIDRIGKDLTVGIYTWVNKTLKAQVYGYGRRMVYEVFLPEPAAQYKVLMRRAFGLEEAFAGGEPPVAPPKASAITPETYLGLADDFGVDDAPAPPAMHVTLTVDLGNDYGGEHHTVFHGWVYSGANTETGGVSVPAGYQAVSFSGATSVNFNGHTSTANVVVHIGSSDLIWQMGGPDTTGPVGLPHLEGSLQVIADTYNVTNFSSHVLVECVVKDSVRAAWQGAVHALLVEAYTKQKAAYDEAKAAYDQAQADKLVAMQDFIRNRNPFFNREIERTQLKAMAISWLTCQFFDQFNAMKQRVQPCGLPQMNLHEAEDEARVIRFWEQAIDWNLMTYLFYPYFWGRKCTWADKIAEDTGDALFDKFMQAGSSRVQIPVAEGFEDHMLYWENTGQLWGQSGQPPVSGDPHWVSMVQEIKHQQDCYLDDREGRIDTAPPSAVVVIKGSDRYWDPVANTVNAAAVLADLDREISIDAVTYKIISITPDPNSPAYDPLNSNTMWWDVTLDRPCEGTTAQALPYAVGAKYIGAPWIVTVPTDLIWLKNDTECLPCYPVTCKGH